MCWMDAQDEVCRVESMEVWGESNQVGNEFAKTNNHIINCKQFFLSITIMLTYFYFFIRYVVHTQCINWIPITKNVLYNNNKNQWINMKYFSVSF